MPRVCFHLDGSTDWGYARCFSGSGTEHSLVCGACSREPGAIEANLRTVSAERFEAIEEGGCWDWDSHAIVGRPQILDARPHFDSIIRTST